MTFKLWKDVASFCVSPKTNINPFEVMRQGKIRHWANTPEDTTAEQPVWLTAVGES